MASTESEWTKKETQMDHEERQRDIDGYEGEVERCRECGQTPEEGACVYCKMD